VAIEEGVDEDDMRAATHIRDGDIKGVLRRRRRLEREQRRQVFL
jgi:hypothetical protein